MERNRPNKDDADCNSATMKKISVMSIKYWRFHDWLCPLAVSFFCTVEILKYEIQGIGKTRYIHKHVKCHVIRHTVILTLHREM